MVTLQQVERGFINYIDKELGQTAQGVQKFIIYFIIPQIPNKIHQLYNQYKNNAMLKDFFDENGNIHLDKVYGYSKEAIRKTGQIEMYGIIFNETDIDKLYNQIKNTTI